MSAAHPSSAELIAEYNELPTSEDRLEWLVARTPLRPPLQDDELDDSLLVPECVSRLWFIAQQDGTLCSFRVRSDSKVVQGVSAFVCDLYNGLSARDILLNGSAPLVELKLEALLSFNRRRTVQRIWSMIQIYAQREDVAP